MTACSTWSCRNRIQGVTLGLEWTSKQHQRILLRYLVSPVLGTKGDAIPTTLLLCCRLSLCVLSGHQSTRHLERY